jgi:glycosyltransferase involved in cell wall biosynthesis
MNLCMVAPVIRKGDGQGRANYEVAHEALRRGHRLTLIGSAVDPSLSGHADATIVAITSCRPPQLRFDIEFRRLSSRWLGKHRQKLDLVMTTGTATAADADVVVAQFTFEGWWRTPHHTWKTNKTARGYYQLMHTTLQRHWERRAFRKSKWHIAVSSSVKDELVALGVDEHTITRIYNGVDINEFKPGAGDRAKYSLPVGVPIGLFVGDIRLNRKNLASVLEALARVDGLHLAVAGDTQRSPFPKMTRAYGLADRVHFLGMRADVALLMRSCDFFVLPSFYEPFSLAVLEAMASGLPVIVSKQVGASELVTSECGFVEHHPDHCDALAERMRLLSAKPDLRRRMGGVARKIAEGHSWATKAAQYLDLLEARARQRKV